MTLMTNTVEPFSVEKLGIMLGNTLEHVKQIKAYILQYFFHTETGVFFFDAAKKAFKPLGPPTDRNSTLSIYIPDGIKVCYCDGEKTVKWPARRWFVTEVFTRYQLITELNKPMVDHQKRQINMMGRLKHSNCNQPFKQFPQPIKQKVQRMLDHLLKVWCSNNTEQYEYVVDWLSCTGRKKLKSALYLQSLEQTGKSMVIDFLRVHVFGKGLVASTCNMEVINQYTQMLEGKVLININEMPCASTGEWKKLMNKLKSLITDPTFDCRRMYEHPRESENTFNLILTSNNDAVSFDYTNFKRYKCLDVSNDYIGNDDYFDKLSQCMNDDVGRAFYVYLKERFESSGHKLRPDSFPHTNTFKDKICEKLDPVFEFLKASFIKPNASVKDVPLKALYQKFQSFHDCRYHKPTVKSDKKFSKMLKDLLSVTFKRKYIDSASSSRPLVFSFKARELYQEFDKKGWLHELDDIDEAMYTSDTAGDGAILDSTDFSTDSEESVASPSDASVEQELIAELDQGLDKNKPAFVQKMLNMVSFD